MAERSGSKAIWIVAGAGVAAVALWVFLGRDEPGGARSGEGAPDSVADGGTASATDEAPPGPALAPAGFLTRRTDEVPSTTLTLAMSDESAHARVCVVGREVEGDPPLDVARCRDATPDEVAPVPRREPTERHIYGPVTAWLVHGEGDAPDHLFASVADDDGDDGAAGAGGGASAGVEIGTVPTASERIRGCQSSHGFALIVDGKLVHGARDVAVAFLDGGAWSAPVVGPTQQYEPALTCRDGEATLTWLESAFEGAAGITLAHQLRCRSTGCEAGQTRVSLEGTDPMASDLAGQVLLVWASHSGTRARLAPLANIGSEGDLGLLHDDSLAVLSRALHVRGGVGIITVRTRGGLYGFRVDTTKRVTPLGVEGE